MPDIEKQITEWRQQMLSAGIKAPVPLDELESHLREDVEQEIRSGLSAQQAFEVAVRRIGQASALKCEFKKVGGSRWAVLQKLKSVFTGFFGGPYAVPFPSLSNFNASAKQTLEFARAEAPLFHHDFIGTEHVLLGLLKLENGGVPNVLREFGVNREAIRTEIEKVVGVGPVHALVAEIPYTPRTRKALQIAASEAKALNHTQVGTEHIFLGLIKEGGGVAALVLKNLGVQVEKTREAILKELGSLGGKASTDS